METVPWPLETEMVLMRREELVRPEEVPLIVFWGALVSRLVVRAGDAVPAVASGGG